LSSGQTSVNFELAVENNENVEISVFRFYISNIILNYSDGSNFSEKNSYHLIDLDEPKSQHLTLNGSSDKEIQQITFTIGTDSLVNVSGALDGDLDPIKGMYWAWNTGYINFKIEGKRNEQPFEYHIGGYTGKHATARTISLPVKAEKSIHVNVQPIPILLSPDLSKATSVLIPGEEASKMADFFQTSFDILLENE
jgi:hypothetical protein